MAYPEPTPVVKGKAAKQLVEDIRRADREPKPNARWQGSRESYEKLRPKDEGN